MTRAELPSYLQAFAAIVALGISVWAVFRSTAAMRRRERLGLNGLAVAIYPELLMLPTMIQNVRDGLVTMKERDGHLVGQNVSASVRITARIEVPPMIDRNVDRLFILGDVAGPSCLQLYRILLQYDSTLDQMTQHLVVLNAEQWKTAVDQLEQHLSLLEQVVAKCTSEVAPIHDAIKG